MDIEYHETLLVDAWNAVVKNNTAYEEKFPFEILKYIVIPANCSTDIIYADDDKRHFCGKKFEPCANYISKLWQRILFSHKDMFESFGRLTHTIQDFYAHTNWVELYPYGTSLWNLELKTLPADIIGCDDSTNSNKIRFLTHDLINKDNPYSVQGGKQVEYGTGIHKNYFEIAYETALLATIEELKKFMLLSENFIINV